MKLNDLRPAPGARRPRKRVARGDAGRGGTYAGRGRKGQNARSGGVKGPYFEGGQLPFVRRLPYRRGFKNVFRVAYTPVSVGRLDGLVGGDGDVTPEVLVRAGVLHHVGEPYKVLGGGAVSAALTVHAPRFSGAARRAIEDAGGRCVALPDDYAPAGMGRRVRR